MPEPGQVPYNHISDKYKQSKELPFRKFIEEHTIRQLLGGLKGKRVLDLACGEGIYSRLMKALGAAHVVGIDISQAMIELAQTREKESGLGIEFRCADAGALETIEPFDIILGSYLLNYARTTEELHKFCRSIFKNLRPGGRFVGINNNPFNAPEDFLLYRKYGFEKLAKEPLREGDPIAYRLYNPDGNVFSFDNYFLSPGSHEAVFSEEGFATFVWHPLALAPEGQTQMEEGYWDLFLERPPLIGMEAIKGF